MLIPFARAFVVIALFLTVLCACAAKDKVPSPPPDAQYSPQGIILNLNATKKLNKYQEQPHTLRLVVYQLTDPAVIKQLSQSSDSLRLLLQGELKNPALVSRHECFVQPGQKTVWKLDRLAETRWVAVVAGYFDLRVKDSIMLFPVPLITQESGWIRKTRNRRLGSLSSTFIWAISA